MGPIAEIATAAQIEEYLSFVDDEEAQEFIAAFWAQRNEGTGVFDKTPEQLFTERAEQADKQYSEGTLPGRRTDRGTIFVIYGEPEKIERDPPRNVDDPTLEVWRYPNDAEPGLGGEKPKDRYRFITIEDSTVFYSPNALNRWKMKNRPELRTRIRN